MNSKAFRLTAMLILAMPGLITLAVLAVIGALDWRYAFGGALVILIRTVRSAGYALDLTGA